MSLMVWTDSFATGVGMIDKQHQELFRLANDLYAMINGSHDGELVRLSLVRLKDYARYHFDLEEECLARAGVLDLDQHREKHRIFEAKVNEMLVACGDSVPLLSEVFYFVRDWLWEHTLNEDTRYRDDFARSGQV